LIGTYGNEDDDDHDDDQSTNAYHPLPVDDPNQIIAVHGNGALTAERKKWRAWLRRHCSVYLNMNKALKPTDGDQAERFLKLWDYFVGKSEWRGLNEHDSVQFDSEWLYNECRGLLNAKLKRERQAERKSQISAPKGVKAGGCSFANLNKTECTKHSKDSTVVCSRSDCDQLVHKLCFTGACSAWYINSDAPELPVCFPCLGKLFPKGPCPTCQESKGLSRQTKCPVCSVHVSL
jgi:hypothetical protein